MRAMKTVFITSFHPLISRNILETEVLARLEASVRVVILVPEKKVEFFRTQFASPHVIIEGVTVPKKRFEDAVHLVSFGLVGVENHVVRGWKTEGRYVKYLVAILLHRFFSGVRVLHTLLRGIARAYLRTDVFEALFDAYSPDLVFATDTFDRADRALIFEARRKGIRTVGMLRSWDNPTTKGVLLAEPDHLIATNEVVKEEMETIHHVLPQNITVTGVPHYDCALPGSRETFFASLGLDPEKKTILFAPGGKILYKHDDEFLRLVQKGLDAGRLGPNVQWLVRLPPGDKIDASPIVGDTRFVIDDPGTNVTGYKKENELTHEDNQRLVDSLGHADVIVTLASTMAIDGMVLGKPIVIAGFDPKPGLPDSVHKFAQYVHLKKFLGTGLVTVASTDDEFFAVLRAYLEHPERDSEEREALVERYAYKLDGKSSERVAACIVRALG